MKHPALLFKLPYTQEEQIEIRGALMSSLVKIKAQRQRIERLETQLKNLSFIIQEQIEEIKVFEAKKWQTHSPSSLPKSRRSL